jgi:biotin transport system substrate-specific component
MTMPVIGAVAVPAPTIADRLAGSGPLARDAVLVVLGAVVIALSAAVSIRLPDNPVPITGQTFGVLLTAGALGGRRGAVAAFLYVAIGVVGLPAFAEGRGGLGVIASVADGRLILGATGGYLIGFIVAAALVGRLAEREWDRRLPRSVAAMLIGNAAIYAVGLPWLAVATGYSAAETIAKGLVPYMLGDLLKLGLAGLALPAAWWLVGRRP